MSMVNSGLKGLYRHFVPNNSDFNRLIKQNKHNYSEVRQIETDHSIIIDQQFQQKETLLYRL